MTTQININGSLTLDQSSGIQDDDTATSNTLAGLDADFITFLNGLAGDPTVNGLTANQLNFTDDVEAVVSGDSFVTVTENDAEVTKLYFSDPNGDLLDGDQVFFDDDDDDGTPPVAMQTIDGDDVYLWSYGDNIVIATTSGDSLAKGDVVAAFYLDPATDSLSASIEMVTFIALDHLDSGDDSAGEHDDTVDFSDFFNLSATAKLSFDFDNLDSGNFLHVTVGSTDAGLMVSGLDPVIKPDGAINKQASDSVNSSQGGTGATIGINNQMFTPGNTAVFSLVEGQTPGTYTDIDDLDFDDHLDVQDTTIFISQVQGNPSTNYTMTIGAFTAGTGDDPEDGRSYLDNDLGSGADLGLDAGDSALKDDVDVAIMRVVVTDDMGFVVSDTTTDDGYVTFNPDGTVTVEGFDAEWMIQWFSDDVTTTDTIETFNRFHVTADEGKFDIGRVDISEGIVITEPVGDQLLVDDDGPTVTVSPGEGSIAHNLDETIDPDGNDTADGADTYNGSETESGSAPDNGDLDDVLIAAVANKLVTIESAPDGDEAIGRLQTTGGDVASLFTVTFNDPDDFGTDGPGDLDGDGRTDTLSLDLSSNTVQTNLIVTALEGTALGSLSEANRTIYLVQVSDTVIEGRIAGTDGVLGTGDDDYVALRITLNDETDLNSATLTTEHFLPIDHDASETVTTPEDPSLYDEEIDLILASGETLKIKLDVVVEDGDDDTASDGAEVTLIDDTGGYLSIDDDGPTVDVKADVDEGELADLHRNLDETIDPDDNHTADSADTYKGAETESVSAPDNGDLDDVVISDVANTPVWEVAPDGYDDVTSEAIGQLGTTAGDLAALFDATDIDFGTDGKGDLGSDTGRTDTLSFVLSEPVKTTLTATAVDGSALDGLEAAEREIWLVKVSDTVVEGRIAGDDGVLGEGDDDYVIFRITITDPTDPVSSTLVYEQFAPVEHDTTTTYDEEAPVLTTNGEDTLKVRWTAVVEDGDDDQATDYVDVTIIDNVNTVMSIDDDGPSVSVSDDSDSTKLEALELNHDETIAPDSPVGEDTYNLNSTAEDDPGEQDDNGDLDDTGISTPALSLAPLTTTAIGHLSTDGTGEISALFDVSTDFGTDGEGDIDTTGEDGRTDTLSLELTGDGPLETNLVATALEGTALEGLDATERTIWLVEVSDTVVEGVIAGADGVVGTGDDDYVVFRITLVNPTDLDTAKLETDQFLPIDHGGSEDPSVYDEEITLKTVETDESLAINLDTTIEDGDDDTATANTSVDIVDTAGGFLSFDDDGPTAAITDTGEMVIHDESEGVQDGTEDEDLNSPDDHLDNDQSLGTLPTAFGFAALGVTAIGWGKSANAVVTTTGTDYGTDGESLSDPAVWSLDVGNDGANADSGFDDLNGNDILLNVEDGIIVGRIDADDSGTVDTDDDIAIAISIDQDGYLSIAQYVAVWHPDTDDEDEWVTMTDNALVAVLTVTDGDGDVNIATEDIGDAVKIEDDAPDAISFVLGDIEEDDLSGSSTGIDEDGSIAANTRGNTPAGNHILVTDMVVASGVDPGTDEKAIFSLSLDSSDMTAMIAANAGLTSKGETVLFNIVQDDNTTPLDPTDDTYTLTGYVDVGDANSTYESGTDRDVFTWVVTAAGIATMTLIDQVDHAFAGTVEENELDIDFTDVLQVTDADGDPVPLPDDFAKYTVADDIPTIGDSAGGTPIADGDVDFMSAATAAVTPGETNTDSHTLNGFIGSDENDLSNETSDGTKTYTFTDNFTDPGYIVDKDGTNDDIYVMGQRVDDDTKIEYRQASWNGSEWVYDEFGTLYFTNELDQDTGDYTFTVLQDPPPSSLEFDFSQLDATKFLFGVVSEGGDGLLVIGSEPVIKGDGTPVKGKGAGDLINTSKGGGETTIGINNQHFTGDSDPLTTEQGAYFTYIEGMVGGTYNDADDIAPSGLIDVHAASLQVSQTQAAGSQPTGMNITVYSTNLDIGQVFVNDLNGSAGTLGEFIVVRVYDEDGTTVLLEAEYDTGETGNAFIISIEVGYTVAFSLDGSEVMITGLEQKDWVSWETIDKHNRVLVEATAGKFDIGAFELDDPRPTPDLMVSSEVQITDFEGDYATDSYDVFIDGTGIYDDDIYDLTPVI